MKAAGFSGEAAQAQNDFWSRMGIKGIRMGSTVLKVGPKKAKKVEEK